MISIYVYQCIICAPLQSCFALKASSIAVAEENPQNSDLLIWAIWNIISSQINTEFLYQMQQNRNRNKSTIHTIEQHIFCREPNWENPRLLENIIEEEWAIDLSQKTLPQ